MLGRISLGLTMTVALTALGLVVWILTTSPWKDEIPHVSVSGSWEVDPLRPPQGVSIVFHCGGDRGVLKVYYPLHRTIVPLLDTDPIVIDGIDLWSLSRKACGVVPTKLLPDANATVTIYCGNEDDGYAGLFDVLWQKEIQNIANSAKPVPINITPLGEQTSSFKGEMKRQCD